MLLNLADGKTLWSTLRQINSTYSPSNTSIQLEQRHTYFSRLFARDGAVHDEFHLSEELDSLLSTVDDILPGVRDEINNDMLNSPISEKEIINSINNLKRGKAGGPDAIIGEFFQSTINYIVPFLNILFNKMWDSGAFPEEWAEAIIIPLFKNGSPDSPDNYRGISLLSIFSKIFTSILNNRLSFWADALNKIDETQAGFRKGYSTMDNVFILQSVVQKYLTKKKGKFYCAFVDFSKAFDTIERQRLWYILLKGGIKGKMFMLLSIYSIVKSRVKTLNGSTDLFNCPFGARQGCMFKSFSFLFFHK